MIRVEESGGHMLGCFAATLRCDLCKAETTGHANGRALALIRARLGRPGWTDAARADGTPGHACPGCSARITNGG